jgi:superfamily I DNA/RNA helicase
VAYDGRWGIIIAGPGTGKTAVLTSRIIRLIEGGSDPASILALSFTVKAAGELRDRIARYTGRYIGGHTGRYTGGHIAGHIAGGLTAATFHSFCCALLREQEGTHGVPSNFRVLAETERRELLRKICAGAEGVKRTGAERLGAYIEGRKRYLLLPGETGPKIALSGSFAIPSPDPGLEPLYERYRQGLREASLLDFDDLPAGAARLLAADPGLLEKYRRRYRHILVDEYQDINFAQYALLSLLVPNTLEAPSLRVIGDPNQAIYAFRGSDPQFIGRFSRDYPEAGSFYLSRSFRCAAPVLEAAGRLSNTCLVGEDRQAGLSTVEYPTEKAEAEGIARRIEALVGGTGFFAFDSGSVDADDGPASQADVSPGDCAVLLRISGLAPAIAKALADHGIPWELTGEAPWWEEEPASSLILKLRAWTAEGSIPAAGPGAVIRLAWEELQREKRPAGSRKRTWKDGEALDRLLTWAAMYDSLASFLDILALSGPGDGTLRRDAVRLMTIHASKGLEFDHVFIPALEEGIIPFTLFDGKHEDPAKIEEEKRLLYVAMTRTRQGLYLSRSRSRKIGNRKTVPAPSRFLEQLNGLIPQETATLRMRPEAPPVSQLPLFQGDAD